MHISKKVVGFFIIFLLYLSLITAIWWEFEKINKVVLQEQTMEAASSYVNLLASFRKLYTSEVINNLSHVEVDVSHDYHRKLNAIPLPATLTMLIAETTRHDDEELEISLLSKYPFPWRAERDLDSFSNKALEALTLKPYEPFYQVEYEGDKVYLRFAQADLMHQACISCHNSHPDSPKTDWKVGDVRGALIVKMPMSSTVNTSNNALRDLLLIVILIAVIAISVNAFILLEPKLAKPTGKNQNRKDKKSDQ